MAGRAPAFYNINPVSRNGISSGDAHRMIYDLFIALYDFCYNVDDDSGVIGSDYLSKLGTPLLAAGTPGDTPLGAVDSTVGNFYTPSSQMNWDGMGQTDVYTAFYDLAIAFYALCSQLDGDTGGALGTDYRAKISVPLAATLGAMLSTPAEGLITSTYFYGLEGRIADGSYSQGDLHKCLYDFYEAIVRICAIFDAGSGTLPATLLTNVGTPLNTAVGQYVLTPNGNTTTGT